MHKFDTRSRTFLAKTYVRVMLGLVYEDRREMERGKFDVVLNLHRSSSFDDRGGACKDGGPECEEMLHASAT